MMVKGGGGDLNARPSLSIAIQGATLLAIIAAMAGVFTRAGAIESQVKSTAESTEQLMITVRELSIAQATFAASSDADRANIRRSIEALTEKLRDLERPRP